MIQLSELTKTFGDRVLFDHVTWQITDRERVGLCGPNGAGKTTLLKMMAGLDEPDSGAILKPTACTVGYLPQDGLSHAGTHGLRGNEQRVRRPAGDEGRDACPRGTPRRPVHSRAPSTTPCSAGTAISRTGSGSTTATRSNSRPRPSCKDSASARPTSSGRTETFSGGWQMRLALAKLLLKQPNLLLLDEPTNHLDLEARNWLEEYLNAYPHAVILVSHDRFFLDAVVTRIADLTLRTLTDYVGNYSDYLVAHEARIEQLRKAKREQDEEVARVKMFIDRFRYQATKASQVQSRIKMLEKVVPIEVPAERKKIHFNFPVCGEERPHGARVEARAQGVRRPGGLQRPEPAHRAGRPHRAGRSQRRRQVHADAHALRRGSAGPG